MSNENIDVRELSVAALIKLTHDGVTNSDIYVGATDIIHELGRRAQLGAHGALLARSLSAVLDALDIETVGDDPEDCVALRDAALKRIAEIGTAIGDDDMSTAAETIARNRAALARICDLRDDAEYTNYGSPEHRALLAAIAATRPVPEPAISVVHDRTASDSATREAGI